MRNLTRRIEGVEKALNQHLGNSEGIRAAVIIDFSDFSTIDDLPEAPSDAQDNATGTETWRQERWKALGPLEEWITYQEQYQAGKKALAERLKQDPVAGLDHNIITIRPSVDAEYSARKKQKATKTNKKAKKRMLA